MATKKPLVFPNEDTLRVALTSGMIPVDDQGEAVQFWREADGTLGILPAKTLDKKAASTLASAGVSFGKVPSDIEDAACWAAVLSPTPVPESELHTDHVLFLMSGERSMLNLAGELLRLGCDRQNYQFVANGKGTLALLRAADPPYFTVASAMDETSEFRAFVPARHGQEVVWTELGFTHPLRETIQAPQGEIVVIGGDGHWHTYSNGPWNDVYQLLDFRLPGDKSDYNATEPSQRLEVPLRLTRATRADSSSLWVIRGQAIAHMDKLVQTLPDDIVARLLFAVGGDPDDPVVILRARMGRSGPPQIDVPGEAYLPLLQISNLYVPRDAIIEPPLRRDKLRELLAPTDDEVAWLARDGEHGFHVESIDDSAFAPLTTWVDYLVHSEAIRLEPWIRSVTFDFEAFQSVGTEWSAGPPPDARPRERKPKPTRDPQRAGRDSETRRGPSQRRRRDAAEARQRVEVDPLAGPVQADVATPDEEALSLLEEEFLEFDAPADDPERTDMWIQMAHLNGRLGRLRDTGLCWTRALWEAEGEDGTRIADWWAEAEGVGQDDVADMISEILTMAEPSRNEVRAVIAYMVYVDAEGLNMAEAVGDLGTIQNWLNEHDDVLDVRSIWMARLALARQSGGDQLAAVRTRDRLLKRLATGLSLERDVPTFLRFLGGGAAGEGSAVSRLVQQVDTLQQAFEKTKRNRSAVEAAEDLTGAYVRFVFAYGFARLGQSDKARELRDRAMGALDTKDPIHGFLARAFAARVEQALEGRPSGTPLPTEISAELNSLEKFERYKVDRLRQASSILELHERLDPVRAFQRGEKDPRGEEFAALRGMTDTEQLAGEIETLIQKAVGAPPEERDRLFDGVMDFFPQLPSRAVPHIQLILGHLDGIEPSRSAMLLEEALMLSGFFGRGELVRTIATTLQGVVSELSPEDAVKVAGKFGTGLRSLRRVGLREEAADLLSAMGNAVSGEGVEPLVARINMAAGLAYLGDMARANPTLTEGHTVLQNDPLTIPNQLDITRALAGAWSQAPQEDAVRGLTRLGDGMAKITDSYNTNSHFCLSVIQFIESIVLGYASEDLALGELGRRWLDEDEYLVRRRIHRDLGALS